MLQSHAPFICKQCISIKHWTPVTDVTEASTFRIMTDPRSHNCFMGFSSFQKIKWIMTSFILRVSFLIFDDKIFGTSFFLIWAILLIFILRSFFTIFQNLQRLRKIILWIDYGPSRWNHTASSTNHRNILEFFEMFQA